MPSPTAAPGGGSAPDTGRPGGCRRARRAAGRMRRPWLRRPHDVAEHGARLDRCRCPGSPTEHEAALRPDGLDEPRHERERDHRGLVNDHDVVLKPFPRMMAETAVHSWAGAWESVQRRRLLRAQQRAHRQCDRQAVGLVVDCLLQPRRGLSRGRGERDPRRRLALLGQRGHDARHGGCLAGPGAAGDDGDPGAVPRPRARRAAGAGHGTSSRRPSPDTFSAHHRCVRFAERQQVGGHLALLAPVAVEVEPGALELQRTTHQAGASQPPQGHPPSSQGRPLRSTGSWVSTIAVSRIVGEVDVDVPEPRAAHGQRHGQLHGGVIDLAQRAQPPRDVHVGGGGRRRRPRKRRSRRRPPVEHLAQRRHERTGRARGVDAAGLARRPHRNR